MKPPRFLYERAESAEHAASLLAELGDEARILAGGQSLLPMLNLRLASPKYLIDISKTTDLKGVEVDNAHVVVWAGATYREVASTSGLPLLADSIALVGHEQIRNRGTLVGSLAHNDPSAELPAVALVTQAKLRLISKSGSRELQADRFYASGYAYDTEAAPDELIEAAVFPVAEARTGQAIVEYARRPGDFATAGVICHVASSGAGTVSECRVATFGGTPSVRMHDGCRQMAEGEPGGLELWSELAGLVSENAVPIDLERARYLQRVYRALTVDALERAWTTAISTRDRVAH